MQIALRTPFGVQITDLDLARLKRDEVAEIAILLSRHGVVVFPGQDLDDAAFVAFLRRFGALVFTTGETPVEGFPDLNVVSNVGRTTAPRSSFHTDSSYLRRPPDYTALRAVEIPDRGGETLFADQYRAFETLPADVRRDLAGRTITHVVTGLDADDLDETSAEHPIFLRHPVSGRTALYLSATQRCAAISEMASLEAELTVRYLLEHSTDEHHVLRHAWSPGDVVMWDNRCVLHRADHSDVVGDRIMHRGMVSAGSLVGP